MSGATSRRLEWAMCIGLLACGGARAAEKSYDVPAGDLTTALHTFAEQTETELVFSPDQLEGLRTRGLKGSLPPRDAVDRLIEGTQLVVSVDPSGAMVIALPRNSKRGRTQRSDAASAGENTARVAGTFTPSEDNQIVVVGTRASLQSAIDRKRKASTIADSIVAEDVAQFPDKNIGEALQRVTGMQLQRDFGEGVAISIRGVEPDLNRVEINGVATLGASGVRSTDLREFASELVKTIDVFKGSTADMTEGGIGGTVSIKTLQPLEIDKPLFVATGSAQYLDTAGTTQPRGNITAASKIFDDRLGFVLNLTFDHVDTRGDYIRNTEWLRLADFDSSTRPDKTTSDPRYASYQTFESCGSIASTADRTACQTQFYDYTPRFPRYSVWQRDDKRTSGQLSVQYRVNDNVDVWAEARVNNRDQRIMDNNFAVDLTTASTIDQSAVVTDANHNVIDLATTGVPPTLAVLGRDFDLHQKSEYYSGGLSWDIGRLKISALGGHSLAYTDNDSGSITLNASVPDLRVRLDPSNGIPRFTFPAGVSWTDATFYNDGPTLAWRPEETESREDHFKLDFDWQVDWPVLRLIEFGAQYRTTHLLRYADGGRVMPDGTVVPGPNVTSRVTIGPTNDLSDPSHPIWDRQRLQDFIAATAVLTPGRFFDNDEVDRDGIPNAWLSPGFAAIDDYFDTSGFNHELVRSANGIPQIPAHDVREDISAVYLKGTFASELFERPFSGNLGVRYTETRDAAEGANTIRELQSDAGSVIEVMRGVQSIGFRSRYRDFLPSANALFEIRPNVLLRFGWAKVLARPKPTDLAPNINCLYDRTPEGMNDSVLDVCSAGNPDLQPYRADQYDLDLAWYPNSDTLLSAAVFYKDVKSFVLPSTLVRGVDLFDDGVFYDVRQPINGQGAKLRGVELSAQTAFTFLPRPFNGLGTVVNYTHTSAKDVGLFNSLSGERLDFPGLSKNSYNVILYYDAGALDVRFAYNARSAWLESAADRSGNPLIRDGSAYLDAKVTYRFTDPNISLFIEAKNLTRETERTTSGDIRLAALSYPGRRYFLGVSYKH